jgi:pyruvate formate lyase activating enzyme
MISGIIFDIKRFAVHDGPGIRTTVFLKGCAANCWWCHNPESQSIEIEKAIRKNQLEGREIEEQEIIGRSITVPELLREISKDRIFFEESGGGVTFSGGEPLMQPEFLKDVLIYSRASGFHTTLDTTGYATAKIFDSIIPHVDLFLYDLKFIDDQLHQKYTGVSNQSILNNLKKISHSDSKFIIRYPVVPGITDEQRNVDQIMDFIVSLKHKKLKLDLLPYHTIARHKYHKMGMAYMMGDKKKPSIKSIKKLKNKLESVGLQVDIGG